jgi:hypothetical protein
MIAVVFDLRQGLISAIALSVVIAAAPSLSASAESSGLTGDPMIGEIVFKGDDADFTDCRTGRRYLVAREGRFQDVAGAYAEARLDPGSPLVAVIDGVTAGASTMMACPPPLDQQERDFIAVLDAVRAARIVGTTLEVTGEDGAQLAFFEAVALP